MSLSLMFGGLSQTGRRWLMVVIAAGVVLSGIAVPSTAQASPRSSVPGVLATACQNGIAHSDTDDIPEDAGGSNADADCEGLVSTASFVAWDERFRAWDGSSNGRRAWGELQNLVTGKIYYTSDATDDVEGSDENLSFDEEDRIRIRACEGTATDQDAYGCTPWAYADA